MDNPVSVKTKTSTFVFFFDGQPHTSDHELSAVCENMNHDTEIDVALRFPDPVGGQCYAVRTTQIGCGREDTIEAACQGLAQWIEENRSVRGVSQVSREVGNPPVTESVRDYIWLAPDGMKRLTFSGEVVPVSVTCHALQMVIENQNVLIESLRFANIELTDLLENTIALVDRQAKARDETDNELDLLTKERNQLRDALSRFLATNIEPTEPKPNPFREFPSDPRRLGG